MAPNKPIPDENAADEIGKHLRLVHVNANSPPEDPALEKEAAFFRQCGFSKPTVRLALAAARKNKTTIEAEMLASGQIKSHIHYRWLAECLNLAYFDQINPRAIVPMGSTDILLRHEGPLRVTSGAEVFTVFVPSARTVGAERKRLLLNPTLGERLAVAAPQTIRKAVWEFDKEARIKARTAALFEINPQASAKFVLTGPQGYLLAAVQAIILVAVFLSPGPALLIFHILLSLFFLATNCLRLVASLFGRRPVRPSLPHALPHKLPVYTILVALKDEAAMANQLIGGLNRLQWPKSLLDIKLVCEASDRKTIEALEAIGLGKQYEIIEVPEHGPQTKPKALQYALAGARGEFVAVYDAEDIPAPLQLLEAWMLFKAGGDRLACVQSPLAIANFRKNWLSALFAVEYAGLFRGMIPFLDRLNLPIPLGGTSNHFRRDILIEIGGWDPYNVTEDADLGFRLYRAGYYTKAAFFATIEVAPENLHDWLNQRSRWLKGWTQTWLVLMREPVRVFRQFGMGGFMTTQILIVGMLVSTLAHPLMYLFIAVSSVQLLTGMATPADPLRITLFSLDIINIVGSYLTILLLGLLCMTKTERSGIKKRHIVLLPFYWLAMSRAAWKAMGELRGKTHYWAKTPHPKLRK